MKKIISALCVLTIMALASCSSDNNGEFQTILDPVKDFSVKGLDKKDKPTDRNQMTLHVEKTDSVKIQFNPGYGSDKGDYTFTFTSSKPEVASIVSVLDGKAGLYTTGDEPGETLITVTSINNPAMKYEFTAKVIKNEIKSLATKTDFTKGMFIREGKELEIGAIVFDPIDASIQEVDFKCADESIAKAEIISVPDGKDKDGKDKFKKVMGIKTFKQGKTTLTISSKDKKSTAKQEIEVNVVKMYDLAKGAWTIALIDYPAAHAAKVNEKNLIDGKNDTYMTLAKPGKVEGVSRETKLAFAIDRQNKEEFNTIQVVHVGKDISQRVRAISIFGREKALDNWTVIQENVKIADVDKEAVESPTIEIAKSTFQHVKVEITEWDTKDGGKDALQIAELNFLGYKAE